MTKKYNERYDAFGEPLNIIPWNPPLQQQRFELLGPVVAGDEKVIEDLKKSWEDFFTQEQRIDDNREARLTQALTLIQEIVDDGKQGLQPGMVLAVAKFIRETRNGL